MNRWLIGLVVILVLGGSWLWWSRPTAAAVPVTTVQGPGVGRVAPGFTLPLLQTGDFVLEEYRGKPVVLNFWATWCGPCQNELPALQKAAAHFGDDVVFVGVDQGETAETVQRYVEKFGLTYAIPLDAHGEVADNYNVKGLPTTFFIDRNGVIQSLWMGEMNSVTLAENIAKIQ